MSAQASTAPERRTTRAATAAAAVSPATGSGNIPAASKKRGRSSESSDDVGGGGANEDTANKSSALPPSKKKNKTWLVGPPRTISLRATPDETAGVGKIEEDFTFPTHWVEEAPDSLAARLCDAWWGSEIKGFLISSPEDPMDLNEAPVDQTYIVIDQSCVSVPPGKIVLRKEYLIARQFIERRAQEVPSRGVIVTGQPGVG